MFLAPEERTAEMWRLIERVMHDLMPKLSRLGAQQAQEDLIAPDGVFKYNPLETENAIKAVRTEISEATMRVQSLAAEIRRALGPEPG